VVYFLLSFHNRLYEVRRRFGVSRSVITELDRAQLRWYAQIERMPGTRYTKQIYQGEVVGTG